MSKGDFPALRMTIDGGRLAPTGAFEAERLNSYRRGTVVFVHFTEEKDRVLVRKWWAILTLVVKQCQTPWKTKEEASEAIKLALGIVNLSKTVGGQFMQYPKSLTELDDPEMTEALENMTELLSRMTGVDVATLKKETAHIVEEPHDPETGEIIEHETTESVSSPRETDNADAPPPASAEAGDSAPTSPASPSTDVSPAGTSGTAGDPDPSSGSPANDPERDVLIRYARDVLPMAADTSVSLLALKEVEKQWAADELSKLSDAGKAKARAISESMRAIANNLGRLEGVLEHYAEMLGCTVDELGGNANGSID
ncbi:hypothetical protein [Rhizobium gallicum]|uniref:hypothetical protein n=1 Tax=Rhizobium gallicum TaxID=56730 RepID=UPI001EF8FC9F|nr:hypothetical protein [Rhizobium gallicum]ULJ73640.1 hypothetical protein L2W42_08730 [Rhizobium gallicum]